MTTPTAHDHPDWGRTVSGADIRVVNASGVQGALFVSHGTFFVGNLPHVHIALETLAGGVQLELDWLDAETGGNQVGLNRVDCLAGVDASGSFPVLAPFVEVFTRVDAIGRNISLDMWQTLSPTPVRTGVFGNELISVFQDPVAAFTEDQYTAIHVCWGWAHWTTLFDNPASWDVKLRAVDYQGNTTLIGYRHVLHPVTEGLIFLPPAVIRMGALNNTAAGVQFTGILLTHPGPL